MISQTGQRAVSLMTIVAAAVLAPAATAHGRSSAIGATATFYDHRLREPLPPHVRSAHDGQETFAFTVFERAFKDFGLPRDSD
jgi:hypothetical protein